MRHLGIPLIALLSVLQPISAAPAVTLQSAYDDAGAGEGYDKLLVLDPGVTYTGELAVDRGVRSCIRGNGALIELENKSIWAAGYGTSLDIDHCILTGGYAGLYISEDAAAAVRNNTIVGNGYGVTSWIASPGVIIENNIIANNVVYGLYCREYFEPSLQYNTVWGNAQGNYIKSCGWGAGEDRVLSPEPGTGEISSDPVFVAPDAGNFSLASMSPCIDAGNPDPVFNDPDGTRNDIGAFYLHRTESAIDPLTWSRMKTRFR